MSPRALRRIVWVVFVAGIGGMIVGSIKDSSGGAITAGIITAVASLGLILITSVAPPGSLLKPGADRPTAEPVAEPDERLARDVEDRITALVDRGADETDVRSLVARAVELGRSATGVRHP